MSETASLPGAVPVDRSGTAHGAREAKTAEPGEALLPGEESSDDEEKAVTEQAVKPADYLATRSPLQVFNEFDTDGSGMIDFGEYKAMLPALGFNISEAKALKYFRAVDADGSGEIDLDEFTMALYTIDPVSGNTLGFTPSKLLMPGDAFEMFDTDRSGKIDEDEFAFILDYMGIDMTDAEQEKWFKKFDRDKSGKIEYEEFKQIWLRSCNAKAELLARGVEVTKWMTKRQMRKRLAIIIDEEELMEKKALALAKQWNEWRMDQRERILQLDRCKARSDAELANAVDCGGQVYLFGRGTNGQFWHKSVRPDMIDFDTLQRMWAERVGHADPTDQRTGGGDGGYFGDAYNAGKKGEDEESDSDDETGSSYSSGASSVSTAKSGGSRGGGSAASASVGSDGSEAGGPMRGLKPGGRPRNPGSLISESTATSTTSASSIDSDDLDAVEAEREYEEAANTVNLFKPLVVAKNTAPLWGRRVSSVAMGAANAMALSDHGEIYTWGGNSVWWTQVEPTSIWANQTKGKGRLTERSEAMLTVLAPTQTEMEEELERQRLRAEREAAKKKKAEKAARKAQKRMANAKGLGKMLANVAAGAGRRGRRGKRGKRGKDKELKAIEEDGGASETEKEWAPMALEDEADDGLGPRGAGSGAAAGAGAGADDDMRSTTSSKGRKSKKATKKHGIRLSNQRKKAEAKAIAEIPEEAVERLATQMVVAADSPSTKGSRSEAGGGGGGGSEVDGWFFGGEEADPYDLDEEAELNFKKKQAEAIEAKRQEERADILKRVTQYYDVWEPAPTAKTRGVFLQNVILPKITFEQLSNSLTFRGHRIVNKNKDDLVELMGDVLDIEVEWLGNVRHRELKELEKSVGFHEQRGATRKARKAREELSMAWMPLMEVMEKRDADKAEERRLKREEEERGVEEHHQLVTLRRKAMMQDPRPFFTPRNTHPHMHLGGVTFRGPKLETFRGGATCRAISAGAYHAVAVHRDGLVFCWGVGTGGRLGMGFGYGGDEDGQADHLRPTVVHGMRGMRVMRASAGFSHTAAVTITGHLYTWGSAMNGKLGLGMLTSDMFECFCPSPQAVTFPKRTEIVDVSCGASHTAAITSNGLLYVWGNSDGARLGIKGVTGDVVTPMLVERLAKKREFIVKVSCGTSHTIALTKVETTETTGEYSKLTVTRGGRVYVCGNPAALGNWHYDFNLVNALLGKPVRSIAAGFTHSAAVTVSGELYTWGHNKTGCLGHPEAVDFLETPTLVKALYVAPRNIALSRHAEVEQSSVYNKLGPEIAVNRDCSGDGEWACTHTQREQYPWWEIDLSQNAALETIHVWNRSDEPVDPSRPRDEYTSRLFPCWLMVSQKPFNRHPQMSLDIALKSCLYKKRLTKNMQKTVVTLPSGLIGRYVRIQLEGFNYMNLAEVEIFGKWGNYSRIGKVTDVACTHAATMVVMAPVADEHDVRTAYRKAVRADANNAVLLRQLPTFFSLADEIGRGEGDTHDCPLCTVEIRCERCVLEERWPTNLGPGPLGRPRRLGSIHEALLKEGPPPLEWEDPEYKEYKGVDAFKAGAVKAVGKLKGLLKRKKKGNALADLDAAPVDDDVPRSEVDSLDGFSAAVDRARGDGGGSADGGGGGAEGGGAAASVGGGASSVSSSRRP